MKTLRVLAVMGLVVACCLCAQAAPWRAGIARTEITPEGPIWLAGYAARNHPSEGVLHPLWAKAMAVEDPSGSRVVILTADLIGLNRTMAEAVCSRVQHKTGIPRERIMMNYSHTHSGPVVGDVAGICHHMNASQEAVAAAYAKTLEDKMAAVIQRAVADLRPAKLAYGEGKATFGMNRRSPQPKGYVISPNRAGPADPAVPVLAVYDEKDRLRATLFGYACHNTTLDIYQVNGDYAGFAQIALEKSHPEATAMFTIGCGGDIDPERRRKVEFAVQHGQALAAAVDQVLAGKLHPITGPVRTAFARIDLALVDPPKKEQLQAWLKDPSPYQQRLARLLLERLDKGHEIAASYPYPVQVVRFGDDLSMVALAGEVVVDYSLRLRKEFPGQRLWIAGYSNEVFAYIPSERILREGGYEGGGAMVYYGIHGPFKPGLEEKIVAEVKKLADQCRTPGR